MFKERETFFPDTNSTSCEEGLIDTGGHYYSNYYGSQYQSDINIISRVTSSNVTMRKKPLPPSSLASSGGDEDDEGSSPNSRNSCCAIGSSGDHFGHRNNKKNNSGGGGDRRSFHSSSSSPNNISNINNNNNCNNNNMKCYGCGKKIHARYYVFAMDHHFHNECLKCHICNGVLSGEPTCFEKDGRILCKQDYHRLYHKPSTRHPRRCARCTNLINPNDLVMRACDLVYHVDCFVCTVCQCTLNRGDQFRMQSTDLYCRLHYDIIENFNASEDFPYRVDPAASCNANPTNNNNNNPNSKSNSQHQTSNSKRGRPPKRKLLSGSVQDNLKEAAEGSLEYFHPDPKPHPILAGLTSLGNMGAELNQIMDAPITAFGLPPSSSHLSGGGGDVSMTNFNPNMMLNGDGTQSQQKGKRMRTTFKHNQLRVMKTYFEMNPNPDTKDLKILSQKTGLNKRVLQVWFQNARAKHRRTCPRSESSLSGGGVLQLEDSQEWSPPPQSFGQPPPSEMGNVIQT